MSQTVIPFKAPAPAPAPKPPRTSRIERLEPVDGEVVWKVSQMHDPQACSRWLDETIQGHPYSGIMALLWMQVPQARRQAERLASFITPNWPSADGAPLMSRALSAAGNKLLEIHHEGTENLPRILGAYLWGLMTVAEAVGRLTVRGVDRSGKVAQWKHFSMPLLDWARENGMTEILASDRADFSRVWMIGLHDHMLTAIAEPTEIGYMRKFAPMG
jgi:hypothetical protein